MSVTRHQFSKSRAPLLLCAGAAAAGLGTGRLVRSFVNPPVGNAGARLPGSTRPVSGDGPASLEISAIPAERMGAFPADGSARSQGVPYWLFLLGSAENATPAALARLLDSIENEPAAVNLLGGRWSQVDPVGMFALLLSRASKTESPRTGSAAEAREESLQKILVAEWFRQDPEALIEALGGTKTVERMKTAKAELLRLLVTADAGRALDLMLDWHMPLDTADGEALVSWVRSHPRRAAELVLKKKLYEPGGSNDDRSLLLKEAAKAMAEKDPIGALKMEPGAHSHLHGDFQQLVLAAWMNHDPSSASAYLFGDELNARQKNGLFSPALLKTWTAKDAGSALEWVESQLSGGAQQNAAHALFQTLATTDPGRAVEFLDRLPPGRAKDKALEAVASVSVNDKAKHQVLEALQWMTALPDRAQRDLAVAAAARGFLKTAPEEYLGWLKSPEGARSSFGVITSTAMALFHEDRGGAVEWTTGVRPEAAGPVRQKLLERWLLDEPAGVAAWVKELPPGGLRADSVTRASQAMAFTGNEDKLAAWLNALPAADHPAILQGLEKSKDLDPAMKATLTAKYR